MSLESLPLKEIRLDGDTQPRVEMSKALVEEYAQEMAEGADFPPISVMHDGSAYWLYDGFHRYHAAYEIGRERMAAEVKDGTRQDAVWESLGANRAHGLRRTNKDKVKAVRKALAVSRDMADGNIALHVGVSDRMVAKYRLEAQSTPNLSGLSTQPRAPTGEIPQPTPNLSGLSARGGASTGEIPHTTPNLSGLSPHARASTGEIPHSTRRLGADGRWRRVRTKPIIGPDRASPGISCEPTDCDLLGKPFPAPHADRLHRAFDQRQHIRRDLDKLIDVAAHAGELVRKANPVYRYLDLPVLKSSLRQAVEALGRICPHAVCPACQGAGCPRCHDRGWIDDWNWMKERQRVPGVAQPPSAVPCRSEGPPPECTAEGGCAT